MKVIIKVLVLIICGAILGVCSSMLRATQNLFIDLIGCFIIYNICGLVSAYFKLRFNIILIIPPVLISIFGIIVNHLATPYFIGEIIAISTGFFVGLYLISTNFKRVILFGFSAILFLFLYGRLLIPNLELRKSTRIFKQAVNNQNFSGFLKDSVSLTTDSGVSFDNSEFRGKVVLVDLWNIHCIPCRQKDKSFKAVADAFKSNSEVLVLSINSGTADSYSAFKDFSNSKILLQGSLYDNEGKLSRILNAPGYPVEFLFDKNGNLRQQFAGFNADMEEVYRFKTIDAVNNLLNEK